MKISKVKVAGLILLLLLTLMSLSILEGGNTIKITSKGRAWAESSGGVVKYGCDNSDNTTCTITIIYSGEN